MNCFKKHNKCFPITSLKNDVYEKIDIHDKSKMPEQGWIHSCVNCGLYTASTILFNRSNHSKKNYEFWFYLCKHCNMKIARNVKEYTIFNKHCSNMIRRYKIKNLNQVPEHAVLPDVSIS